MIRKVFAIIGVSFVLLAIGCVRRVHDYTFSVTGFVTADDGRPLQNAEVTLSLDAPVYEGITPLKSRRVLTNANGSFIFMYLTGNATTKYRLMVRKEGFESQTLSGTSPPAEHHTVRLKNAQKTKASG